MTKGILLVALIANISALFCIFNPWFEDWISQGILFFVAEAVFLVLIGTPVFVHHLRKGLSPRKALGASMDSVMSVVAGWV